NILVKSPFRGEYWEEVSPDLTTNDPSKLTTGRGGDGNIQYCTITTIDESPLVAGVLWVGADDGNVQVSRDGGKKWTKLNDKITGNPGYWVSRVTASHHDPGTAYVSYTGYRRDDFRPFLYKTTDYGETWISIVGNLPDGPINVIKEDHKNPNLLFVGTEFAVYVSLDGGKRWIRMKNNMPTQPVQDLVIHPRENDLVVATHGRGIFITDISALQDMTPEVLSKDVYLCNIESKIRWISNKRMNSGTSNFFGESEPTGIVINYYLKNKVNGDVKVTVFKGNMVINELKGSNAAGMHNVTWDMTKRRAGAAANQRTQQMMQRMRRFGSRGQMMPLGEYRFVLTVGDQTFTKYASILQDHWY
ncbi:MAG: hypothetical protein KAU46_09785, partial [Candidatus Aminicenantes bacterium]|nr:hypothetical protein [Candidatus Aminicenantes bacterium]